ncbi:MAG: gliding motility-associated C-terminal domain-containing protein [Crocinitomicaceae bacterium]|nr:gliding motility-associated C-terminal domain-containing protein [Crocinitomicaceae bacterium]
MNSHVNSKINKIFNPGFFIFIVIFIHSGFSVRSQNIVINEVSQGPSGSKEYVEFLVTGPPLIYCDDTPTCIDLQGYIFDDNNGYLNGAPTSGVGIASGACRFANDPFWSCIPAGTLIVIYNDADINGSMPAQDISMADGNCTLVIPISSTLFDRHNTLPSSSDGSYATTGWISGGSWTPISMANTADGFQIYEPSNTTTPVFSVGWGPTNSLGDIYMGSGSASGEVYFADDCDFFNQTSWIDGSASTQQSPGSLNPSQSSCVGAMNASCDPPVITLSPTDETCAGSCDGSIAATVTGGSGLYTMSWSPAPGSGQGTNNASGLCADNFTFTIIDQNGTGCELSANTTVNSLGASVTPTFTAVAPICAGDALAALPTTSNNGITGSWSPALDNTTTTLYTFTPDAGQCANTTTLSITVNSSITPTFTAVTPICAGDALAALPTTSNNGITGSWSPALDNTTTTLYTFTPDAGQCASTTTLTITVNSSVTPTFTAVTPICAGDALAALPTTSNNGITGSWSPALDNTTTTLYTFTPDAGQCANTTTLTITVNSSVTPTFTAVTPICAGDALAALPTTSNNGITGSWSPAIDNTTTTLYTFTPDAGQCANTTTLTITVNSSITPTFTAVAPICAGDALAALPTTSNNGITGSWSPALDNTTTTLYTFTPDAGQCANTTTLTITVNSTINISVDVTICTGTDYTFPDGITHTNILLDETYFSILNTFSGCDSIIATNLFVTSGFSTSETVNICSGSDYTFADGTVHTNITINESYISTLMSMGGCDSLVTTNILVNSSFTNTEFLTICEGENHQFPDGTIQTITSNTTYISNLFTTAGCDSVITTQVTMIPSSNTLVNVTVCENSSYTFPDGTTQIISGFTTQTSVLASINGCDSLITSQISVNPIYQQTENISLCMGENYTFPDGTIHFNIISDEQYQSTFTSISGCDSIWITNILVIPLPTIDAGNDISVCEDIPVTLNASGADFYSWDQGMMNGVSVILLPGTYTFTVTGTSIAGCEASDGVSVIVNPNPQPNFNADVNAGCAPLIVNFSVSNTSSSGTFFWNFGNGNSGIGMNGTTQYTTSGQYDVSLSYTDDNGCNALVLYTNYIDVFDTLVATFTYNPQQPDMLNSEVIFDNNSIGATSYHWSFGDGTQSSDENPSHSYSGTPGSNYIVTLIVSNSVCEDTAQSIIQIQDQIIFYVPNAFTPDGDEYNEIFQPVFTSGFDPYDYHLMIFNRWGELIFESFNATVGWNGTYSDQGLVQDDVYVWKIDFKETMSDKRHTRTGHVVLLR